MTKVVVKKADNSEDHEDKDKEVENKEQRAEKEKVEEKEESKKEKEKTDQNEEVEEEDEKEILVEEETERDIKKVVESREEKSDFLSTNVKGFDELLAEGIPKGSQVLVSGGPGTLKTTFCMQVAVNLANRGKKALYLSFEEPKKNLLRNLHSYDWDILDLIKSGNLVIRKMDPFSMSRSVETLLAQARGELLIEVNEAKNLIPENMKPDIIIVDSLSAIAAGFFGKEEGYRAYVSQIFETFRELETTSLLVTEVEHSTTKYSKTGVEEFLADGVFVFYNFRQGSERINATEVIKLRGVEHKKKIAPFKVEEKGIVVYPNEELFVD